MSYYVPLGPMPGRTVFSQAPVMSGATGRRKTSTAEKVYLAIVIVESVLVTILSLAAFSLTARRIPVANKNTLSISIYMAIFLLGRLFSLLYCLDAIRARNVVQLVLHIAFQICMLVYAILEIPQARLTLRNVNMPGPCVVLPGGRFDCLGEGSLYATLRFILMWNPIIIGCATFVYCLLVRSLQRQFGWDVYRAVQASPDLKKMLREYQTMVSLLKLVAFFASAFCMAYIVLASRLFEHRAEFIITVVALPLFYPSLFLTAWALRHENYLAMGTCLVLLLAGEAYFIYKMITLWKPSWEWLYSNVRVTLAVFSAFAIVLLMVTFVYGCLCMANFGKGLLSTHTNADNRTAILPRQQRKKSQISQYEEQLEDRFVVD